MRALRQRPEYPRASTYDPGWLLELDMGPNPLWLLEDLATYLDLRPRMRVLDLGSGRGASSVFLAREFGGEVWATDLLVDPAVATEVFRQTGVDDQVHAVQADAWRLPFDPEMFDVVVSIDAFEYFGTDDHYLPYFQRFVAPGGQIGVATPALRREVHELGAIPEHIRGLVGWEALAWHTPAWWRFQWSITHLVDVEVATFQERGWENWLLWARANAAHELPGSQATLAMLEADRGHFLSFALLVARKRVPPA